MSPAYASLRPQRRAGPLHLFRNLAAVANRHRAFACFLLLKIVPEPTLVWSRFPIVRESYDCHYAALLRRFFAVIVFNHLHVVFFKLLVGEADHFDDQRLTALEVAARLAPCSI
jgi:hypothetical protein